jgi:hypothetical protein
MDARMSPWRRRPTKLAVEQPRGAARATAAGFYKLTEAGGSDKYDREDQTVDEIV